MIAFDLDGTLVDSEGEIRAAMAHAWSVALPGLPSPLHELQIGPPLLPMIAALTPHLEDAQRAELVRVFRERYDASDFSATLPYPGIAALLETLAARGETLAIATNKRHLPTMKIVGRWFPSWFAAVSGIDGVWPDDGTVPGDKPAMLQWLAAAKFTKGAGDHVLVGDTTGDIKAARAAGFRSIAVTWGYEAEESLRKASPDVIVHDAAGLAEALA